jgi:hypothetical protein
MARANSATVACARAAASASCSRGVSGLYLTEGGRGEAGIDDSLARDRATVTSVIR